MRLAFENFITGASAWWEGSDRTLDETKADVVYEMFSIAEDQNEINEIEKRVSNRESTNFI